MSTGQFEKSIVDGRESIVIESTLPPTNSHELLAAEGATVLVFSHDAALARVIRGVAAERYPIRIINEWNDLLEQIGSGKGRIVLLDVDALADDVEDALAQVNRCADWLVMVIAARQQQAQDFMRFWSERRIHRLLIKPAAAGITRLLLESAFARFIELRELHENTDSMEILPEPVAEEEVKRRHRWLWPAVAAGVVAVAAAAIFSTDLLTSAPTSAPSATAAIPRPRDVSSAIAPAYEAPPDDEVSVEAGEFAAPSGQDSADVVHVDAFEGLLRSAREAEFGGSFVEPPGANALDFYAAILTQAPDHAEARARLEALLEDQFAIAQIQIMDREFAAADVTLGHIGRANPSGTRLQFLRDQIIQLRQASAAPGVPAQVGAEQPGNVEQPVGGGAINEPTELQSMLTLLRLRLDEGRLVEPAGDSARDYFQRALDLDVDEADIQAPAQRFSEMVAEAIPRALSAGNVDAASLMLSTARRLGSQAPELAGLESQVLNAQAELAELQNNSLHARALLRIDDGIYVGRDDSAIALLNQLAERDAEATLIADIEGRLAEALPRAARTAISAGEWNEAQSLLRALAAAAPELSVIATLEGELEVARQQESFMAQTVAVGEMTLLDAAPAVYPRAARLAETTGWVDLHFTVDTAGTTTDIEVVDASPAGQFEDAAIAALTGYRFEPFALDEHVYERRVRLRMRFELD